MDRNEDKRSKIYQFISKKISAMKVSLIKCAIIAVKGTAVLIVVLWLIIVSGILDRTMMDEEKCAKIAINYLEEKYGVEFVVVSSNEQVRYGPIRVEVLVNRVGDEENINYKVTIYPDGKDDKDKDGYYDNYKIISDDYMMEILSPLAKTETDELLKEVGMKRFISYVEMNGIGKSTPKDFPVLDEENFLMSEVFERYDIDLYCWIEIPENEYRSSLEDDIKSKFEVLISGDRVSFMIDVYSEEVYMEREKNEENGKIDKKLGNRNHIYFSIKEN